MQLKQLTGKSPVVLARILDFLDGGKEAYISIRGLGRDCGLGIDSIFNIIERLKKFGILKVRVEKASNKNKFTTTSNHYYVGPTLLKLKYAWDISSDGCFDYKALADDIFKSAMKKSKNPLGKTERTPLGKTEREPVRENRTKSITILREKKIESRKAANAALIPSFSFPKGYSPEEVLLKIQSRLGPMTSPADGNRTCRRDKLSRIIFRIVKVGKILSLDYEDVFEQLLEFVEKDISEERPWNLNAFLTLFLWKNAFPEALDIRGDLICYNYPNKVSRRDTLYNYDTGMN